MSKRVRVWKVVRTHGGGLYSAIIYRHSEYRWLRRYVRRYDGGRCVALSLAFSSRDSAERFARSESHWTKELGQRLEVWPANARTAKPLDKVCHLPWGRGVGETARKMFEKFAKSDSMIGSPAGGAPAGTVRCTDLRLLGKRPLAVYRAGERV